MLRLQHFKHFKRMDGRTTPYRAASHPQFAAKRRDVDFMVSAQRTSRRRSTPLKEPDWHRFDPFCRALVPGEKRGNLFPRCDCSYSSRRSDAKSGLWLKHRGVVSTFLLLCAGAKGDKGRCALI